MTSSFCPFRAANFNSCFGSLVAGYVQHAPREFCGGNYARCVFIDNSSAAGSEGPIPARYANLKREDARWEHFDD